MAQLFEDTHPKIEAMLIERLREMSVSQRWRSMESYNRTLRTLAISDIRRLHPQATEQEVRYHLAARLYGESIARLVYNPSEEKETLDGAA